MNEDQDGDIVRAISLKVGSGEPQSRQYCSCFDPVEAAERRGWRPGKSAKGGGPSKSPPWRELELHRDIQDTAGEAWHRLLELIDRTEREGREEFSPGRELGPELWPQIVTLPPGIGRLKSVRKLNLYGSSLVRIPPEIGEMTALEEFIPYTSYRLHWYPYEITRCPLLVQSTVSTRALYGNYKYRPPFPRLPQLFPEIAPMRCSVCSGPFDSGDPLQYWISLGVATDVLPLLIHACSSACVSRLPSRPEDFQESAYVDPSQEPYPDDPDPLNHYLVGPHQGGLELHQPEGHDDWDSRTSRAYRLGE